VSTGEKTGTGTNWVALTDGNATAGRTWPSANTTGAHKLASLCMDASGDSDAVIYDFRWR
jgi:hypothetical protein